HSAIALDARLSPDGDYRADRRPEVVGGPERSLEPGARDLEGVVTGDRVGMVELARHDARRQRDGLEVDAAGAGDRDPHDTPGVLEVVQRQTEVGQERQHQLTNAVGGRGHGGLTSCSWRWASGRVAVGLRRRACFAVGRSWPLSERRAWAEPTPP